jgi:hypothetical protein
LNKHLKILINYFFGPLIFLLLSWAIYRQLMMQPDLPARWLHLRNGLHSWKTWLVLLLAGVNWGLESEKWRLLIRNLQAFPFTKACQSVLAGCSITLFTPNRVGEYGGRILFVNPENRLKAISLNIAASISQLLVTLIMGCLGLIFLRIHSQHTNPDLRILPEIWSDAVLFISVSITGLILIFYLRIGFLVVQIKKMPFMKRAVKHISILESLDNRLLGRIFSLSFLRYSVFIVQYILLLQVMGVALDQLTCMLTIMVYYLLVTAAPSFGLIELPIRITALWLLLKPFTPNELGVGGAALAIWVINLALPAFIGSIFILGVKFFPETK